MSPELQEIQTRKPSQPAELWQRSRWQVLVLTLAALLAGLLVRSAVDTERSPPWLLHVDDSYIFVRYAQQAARGMPMQWNDGEASTGATDLAFTALLIPGQWLFGDLPGWSRWSMLVGVLSLAGLGLAARSLTSALLGRPGPWPLAAGLAVIGGGPFAHFAVGGMDNAFASAVLLAALARVVGSGGRRGFLWIALLPWVRPDFAVVVGMVALAVAWGLFPESLSRGRRLVHCVLLFVPGLFLMTLNLAATGLAAPGGALSKSILSEPFGSTGSVLRLAWEQAELLMIPTYLGQFPQFLPPPVGILAVLAVVWSLWRAGRSDVGGFTGDVARRLVAPALCWSALAAVATTSAYLWWQRLRHHHPGLALAWVFAFVLAALFSEWVVERGTAERRRFAGATALVLGLLPWLGLGEVSRDHAEGVQSLYQWNFQPAAWLQRHLQGLAEQPEVALHDAGLLALAIDGPMVDLMGLGTTDLALPYRDGVGALVEHLARRDPLPELAVGRTKLLRLGPLLGEAIFTSPRDSPEATVVAPIRSQYLRGTVLEGEGVDFGYQPSEKRVHLRWSPVAPPSSISMAVILLSGDGADPSEAVAQGCRPVYGELEMGIGDLATDAAPGSALQLRFTAVDVGPARGRADLAVGIDGVELRASADRSEPVALGIPFGEKLTVRRQGEGLPCLESLSVVAPGRD